MSSVATPSSLRELPDIVVACFIHRAVRGSDWDTLRAEEWSVLSDSVATLGKVRRRDRAWPRTLLGCLTAWPLLMCHQVPVSEEDPAATWIGVEGHEAVGFLSVWGTSVRALVGTLGFTFNLRMTSHLRPPLCPRTQPFASKSTVAALGMLTRYSPSCRVGVLRAWHSQPPALLLQAATEARLPLGTTQARA